MKKVVVIIMLLILISSPVSAFSIKDFLINFGDFFTGITGKTIECNEGETKCGTGDESFCVLSCQGGGWISSFCCAYQCSNGECISEENYDTAPFGGGDDYIIQEGECNENEVSENFCFTGSAGICNYGTQTRICNENNEWGPWGSCVQDTNPGEQSEICNDEFGDDEDCDGLSNSNDPNCPDEPETPTNPNEPQRMEGEESNDPNILNRAPIIMPTPEKIVKISESIEFEIKAIDPNNDPLNYYFENGLNTLSTDILDCSIIENKVNCNALKEGKEILNVKVSDEIDETGTEIVILVLKELPQFQRGIAAGIANTPPVADAGPDRIGFPGQKIILDASKSYDKEGLLSIPETYKWHENNNIIGTGKFLEKISPLGYYEIKLIVTDSEGLTSEDISIIKIEGKKACKNTQTSYFPEDTLCNNKWPIKEGFSFKINSLTEGSCSLFEVCSDDIDYVIEDSTKCCTEGLSDPEKIPACNFATENSETFRNCLALYIIESLGKSAVYMKGYFDAEMCCKGVDALCPKTSYLYTPQPLPDYLRGVKCSNTPENNPNGHWASDTKLDLNEIALFDAPAHSSLNILETGTCVDYSVSITTLLRKIGFSSDNIMTVEASNHAYNLVRFDLDKKYTIFDMTGNNEGLKLGNVPSGYDYCENIMNCYNDFGKVPCPNNKEINGCENAKESIGRTTGTVGYKITNTLKDLFNKIKAEVLR